MKRSKSKPIILLSNTHTCTDRSNGKLDILWGVQLWINGIAAYEARMGNNIFCLYCVNSFHMNHIQQLCDFKNMHHFWIKWIVEKRFLRNKWFLYYPTNILMIKNILDNNNLILNHDAAISHFSLDDKFPKVSLVILQTRPEMIRDRTRVVLTFQIFDIAFFVLMVLWCRRKQQKRGPGEKPEVAAPNGPRSQLPLSLEFPSPNLEVSFPAAICPEWDSGDI